MNTYSARLRAAIEQSDKSRKKLAAFMPCTKGGAAMLKQVFIEGDGSLTLHSFNPTWRDKQVHEHNGSDFKILGRQFWRAG